MMDVSRNLPSAEEVLRTLGLQRARSGGGELLGGIAVFGAGMLVGAGLALLFAPASGSETREQLGSKIGEVKEKVAGKASEVGERVRAANGG
jgi:gas vesicle protein